MKRLLSFLSCCFFSFGAIAQTSDTSFVTVSTETGTLTKQQITDQYDYLFGTKVPARWMFKWNPVAGLDQQGALNLSAEHKISPAFSLQLAYGIGGANYNDSLKLVVVNSDTFFSTESIAYHHFNVQTRWYFDMPKRILENKSANNFSGNYLALEMALTAYGLGLHGRNAQFASKNANIALRFGVQRRLFKYAYFDISYGIGARRVTGFDGYTNSPLKRLDFFANTQVAFGIAIFKPKMLLKQELTQCDVLQCFREERRMWKIDLFNLIRISDSHNAKASLSIAREQKLAQSPFSVEIEVHAGANSNRSNLFIGHYNNSGWNIGAQVQPRFYYMMRKQIVSGKSGNNLSGPYFALHTFYKYKSLVKEDSFQDTSYKFDGTEQSFRVGPAWGFQYRIFKYVFIDLNFGMGFGVDLTRGATNNAPVTQNLANSFDGFGNFRIGIAL